MEYTKLWQASDAQLEQQDASKLWCLTRVRRMIHRPRITNLDLNHLFEKVNHELELNNSSLTVCGAAVCTSSSQMQPCFNQQQSLFSITASKTS